MIWQQHWRDVLFLHFPVSTKELAAHLPRQLEVDTFEGQAWLSYIFFRLTLRPAWLPVVPGVSSLVELNVRTYVRYGARSGIYFLRMYADNQIAILASRLLTPLRYQLAGMIDQRCTDGIRHIECRPALAHGATLAANVQIAVPSAPAPALADSLDQWLVERYCLFVETTGGAILAANVEHTPWLVAPIRLSAVDDSLGPSLGLSLPAAPTLAHYSPGVAARFNAFHRAKQQVRS